MSDFSSNLRRLRKRAGLSQDALAEKLSVARQTVSSWERGNSYPDLDMLVRISDALATDPNELLYPNQKRRSGGVSRLVDDDFFGKLTVVIWIVGFLLGLSARQSRLCVGAEPHLVAFRVFRRAAMLGSRIFDRHGVSRPSEDHRPFERARRVSGHSLPRILPFSSKTAMMDLLYMNRRLALDITTILFDLDGTLLPMDQEAFTTGYFKLLAKKLALYGYEPKSLVDAIWAGTAAMVKNDGSCTNEQAFWKRFAAIYGEEKCQSDQGLFEDFYANEFNAARDICGFNPASVETVHKLKECGYRVALATNPIFPHVATENRIRWAGLVPEDFEIYTTYEASTFCKPNPAYYLEVARTLGVKPEECLMVGNDATEDMAAREVGMDVFLLTDCLINAKNRDLNAYPRGDFAALNAYIDALQ